MIQETWSGQTPKRATYFLAAGCSIYFEGFAPSLAMSAVKIGMPIHIHVVNPSLTAITIATCMNMIPDVTVTWSEAGGISEDKDRRTAFYANARIRLLPHLLAAPGVERIYVVDIDSIFNRRPDLTVSKPIGLRLRDKPAPHKKLLAGLFWVDAERLDYAQAVADFVDRSDLYWGVDQEALYATMVDMDLRDEVHDIGGDDLVVDWEFRPDGILWTGKGPRKHEGAFWERVVALRREFNHMLKGMAA